MNLNRTVYIQKQNNNWLNESCFSANYGFERMGYTIKTFEISDIDFINVDKKTIVHGGINTIRKIFDKLNVKQPEIHNVDDYLIDYTKRIVGQCLLSDIRNFILPFPIFIKPLTEHKLFTGLVINSEFDFMKIRTLPDDTKILYSDVMNFKSEYRCFILDKKLVGCKNYTGDFTKFPDFETIEYAINDYKEQPIAYSLDFAVTNEGETVLIEINDGFSLGTYGLNPILYCKMIERRWDEIIK